MGKNIVMSAENSRIIISRVFWVFPVIVIFISYIYLSLEYKSLFIFSSKVHESGKYTLVQSMMYFDHFTREIPVSVMNALSVSVSFYLFAPVHGVSLSFPKKVFYITLIFLVSFLFFVVSGAVYKNGFQSFFLDLLQFRTRDEEIAYGSHWHSHFLDMMFIFAASLSISFFYRIIAQSYSNSINLLGFRLLGIWSGVFILLTLIFIPSIKSFSDTRYLAHQFREIITHSTVTIPLSFAILIYLEKKLSAGFETKTTNVKYKYVGFIMSGCALLIPFFIVLSLAGRNILAEAQKKTGYWNLLASHYFEHSLDYIFVPTLTMFLYVMFIRIAGRNRA